MAERKNRFYCLFWDKGMHNVQRWKIVRNNAPEVFLEGWQKRLIVACCFRRAPSGIQVLIWDLVEFIGGLSWFYAVSRTSFTVVWKNKPKEQWKWSVSCGQFIWNCSGYFHVGVDMLNYNDRLLQELHSTCGKASRANSATKVTTGSAKE